MQNFVTWAISVEKQNVFFSPTHSLQGPCLEPEKWSKNDIGTVRNQRFVKKNEKKSPYFAVICSELLSNHKVVDETTPGVLRDSLAMFEPILVHHFLVQRKLGSEKGWPPIAYSWPS